MREFARPLFSGSYARTSGLKVLRTACLVTLAAIAAQFALGMLLNLYVQVPSSDSHASWFQEIETAPVALTAHAVIGLLLVAGAAVVTIQAIAVRDWPLITVAGAGLVALVGAFAAGEVFVKDGSNVLSLTMSLLASVALLCYVIVHAVAGAAARRTVGQS